MSETLSLVDFVVGANSTALNCGAVRAKKKVRQRPELSMEIFDSTMDGYGQMVQEENVAKDSYKAKLMGDSSILDRNVCMEEDFELQDEDVTTETVNEISSITFADRNIRGQFQLMDLESEFYLVRFQDKDDLDNVLLGLSKGYYSDFLLRAIESMIGPVFCIDAQTNAAVRGQFIRLAISVDLKKNHWLYGHGSSLCTRNKSTMEEDMGKSRDSSEVRSFSGNDHFGGSRFIVLEVEGEEITVTPPYPRLSPESSTRHY
ncbi:hypothetical protein CXB51_004744 [Gossypium anomalum]|uniref:DUF4283 domain-containing protein n=1 Tax=Gossypium anomalum TaxID=47600 RepID=A0A8J5ZHR7_9ROSI|nr:hypothetical protein CXB51_004744 [Gossypium anomalum]